MPKNANASLSARLSYTSSDRFFPKVEVASSSLVTRAEPLLQPEIKYVLGVQGGKTRSAFPAVQAIVI
jgi:hypothetical protein